MRDLRELIRDKSRCARSSVKSLFRSCQFSIPLLVFGLGMMQEVQAYAGPATQLVVSTDICLIENCPSGPHSPPPTVALSGDPFGIFVAALDSGNGIAINHTGTVIFSSSDPAATLPMPYTFVPADEGGNGFIVVLRTPGSQTITARDSSGSLIPGVLTMTVTGPVPAIGVPAATTLVLVVLSLLLASAGIWLCRTVK